MLVYNILYYVFPWGGSRNLNPAKWGGIAKSRTLFIGGIAKFTW